MEKHRTARDFDSLTGAEKTKLKELVRICQQEEVIEDLRNRFIDILGPLTVRERWQLLGEVGLGDMRPMIILEGSANDVATLTLSYAFQFGYPFNVSIIQAIAQISGLGDLTGQLVAPFVDQFTQEQK